MKFVTLFPECENVHLMKEQGMLPYFLNKEYGIEGVIACYADNSYKIYGKSDFEYLKVLGDRLKIEKIKNFTHNPTIDGILYLLKNARKIDILYMFHLRKRSMFWFCVYKFVNPKGKVYLEIDADQNILKFTFDKISLKRKAVKKILERCDLISNSIPSVADDLTKKWKIPVHYVPRGFYTTGEREGIDISTKQNVFCTVGRIGDQQKATDILLEGYKLYVDRKGKWDLRIVGPVEEEFKNYLKRYFDKAPYLRTRVYFTGPIIDKTELDREYDKAKVFCLTSRGEAFALVYAEALKGGCYIISTDVGAARDILDGYGEIFPVDAVEKLTEIMLKISMKDDEWFARAAHRANEYAYDQFFWPNICKKVYKLLKL